MKECDIVQDLLIGYNDKTLKEGSKELVKEHLKQCENCRKVFDEIKSDDIQEDERIEIDYLKKINKKNSNKNICIILLIILAVIIVFLNIIVFIIYYNTDAGIEVFLEDDISIEQFEKIENIIKNSSYEYRYKSKKESFESFKEKLEEKNQKILEGYEENLNIFPASFVIKTGWGKGDELISNIENIDGIKKITSNTKLNPYLVFYSSVMKILNKI